MTSPVVETANTHNRKTMEPHTDKLRVIRAQNVPQEAIRDLWEGLARYDMWSRFAFHEIRQRFRRSVLGPFWLTASMGVFVGALGLITGTLFNQEMGEALPYIAVGVIFWTFLTSCITEGAVVFISRDGYIRNVPMPISVHLYQMIARNIIVLGFNMVIYLAIIVIFRINPGPHLLEFILAAPLFLCNVTWVALSFGIMSARFRDIPQVINSLVQVVFILTPVFWSVSNLPHRPAFVTYNPVYHLLEIVRQPLLGHSPSPLSWLVAISGAIAGLALAAYLYRRAQPRLAYWV